MPLATSVEEKLTQIGSVAERSDLGAKPEHETSDSRAEPLAEEGPSPQAAHATSDEEELLRQVHNLPPELAVLLLSVGALGFVLPGIIGTPALIAGGLALWPKAFGRAETWFAKRYPSIHRKSLHQMGRFLADLDRRYPQFRDT